MKRLIPALIVLVLATLACGAPAIVPPDPENYVAPYLVSTTATPFQPEPTLELTTLIAVTDTYTHDCDSLLCDEVGHISKGAVVTAFCKGEWCFSREYRGWFCQAALIGTGGCDENE